MSKEDKSILCFYAGMCAYIAAVIACFSVFCVSLMSMKTERDRAGNEASRIARDYSWFFEQSKRIEVLSWKCRELTPVDALYSSCREILSREIDKYNFRAVLCHTRDTWECQLLPFQYSLIEELAAGQNKYYGGICYGRGKKDSKEGRKESRKD